MSLPSWERGLKPENDDPVVRKDLSLPSWERGLKHLLCSPFLSPFRVAPFVGAWIETPFFPVKTFLPIVAPFVGAWIETSMLKMNDSDQVVAPFVGAWIETTGMELEL